jgi:hypothetical protein
VRAFNSGAYSSYTNIATTTTGNALNDRVALWRLDGNSNDSVGTNNGSDTNVTYSTSNGVINEGAAFNGSKIDIGNIISGSPNISASAWVKTTAMGTQRVIDQVDSLNGHGQWSLYLNDGVPAFYTERGGQGGGVVSANVAVNDGNWHQVGVSQSGTTYTFYVDGVQMNSVTQGDLISYESDVTAAIGYNRRGGSEYFNGDIDEVGVWNATLSASDFATLYNQVTFSTTTPNAPSGLSGTAVSSSQINLSWTDNSSNENGFNVERSTNGTTWTQVATTTGDVTSYSDTGLSTLTTYYHRVRAFGQGGRYSDYSNVATTTVLSSVAAYWKLDGNSNDAKGSNNGSDTNVSYSTSTGIINEGAGFDGSSSGINVGQMASGLVNVSISAWIKTTASTTNELIAQQRDGTNGLGQWKFEIVNGKVQFYTERGGHGSGAVDGNSFVADGNWHNVGVTQNDSTYTFYVDGVQDGSVTQGDAIAYDTPSGSIGYDRRDGNEYFNGDIDEVGVWNITLSGSDFATLYNSGAGDQYPF